MPGDANPNSPLTWREDPLTSTWYADSEDGRYRILWSGHRYVGLLNGRTVAEGPDRVSARNQAQLDYNDRRKHRRTPVATVNVASVAAAIRDVRAVVTNTPAPDGGFAQAAVTLALDSLARILNIDPDTTR